MENRISPLDPVEKIYLAERTMSQWLALCQRVNPLEVHEAERIGERYTAQLADEAGVVVAHLQNWAQIRSASVASCSNVFSLSKRKGTHLGHGRKHEVVAGCTPFTQGQIFD